MTIMHVWILMLFSLCLYHRNGVKMDHSEISTPTKRTVSSVSSTTGGAVLGATRRPWKWCMVCNIVLDKKAHFKSFRPELKGSSELVRRCNEVLGVDIRDVTPNSYNVCESCIRRLKKVEEGVRVQNAMREDFTQTVVCNRLTSPTTTPVSSPATTVRIKRMAKDQGTPPANQRESGVDSRPKKRALIYTTADDDDNPQIQPTPHEIVQVSTIKQL